MALQQTELYIAYYITARYNREANTHKTEVIIFSAHKCAILSFWSHDIRLYSYPGVMVA